MPYSPEDIYRVARAAGFSPDQATTMTAIALAESRGNLSAHNSSGEDSRGLWQINLDAHRSWAGDMDLTDPVQNALAAYRVSRGGTDISPWTVTHGGTGARYLQFQDEAHAAALANGDPGGLGVWTGTDGYGHQVAAGAGGGDPGEVMAEMALLGGQDADPEALRTFLDAALAQTGEPYVFGAQVELADADPDAWDCSELVRWAAHQAGVEMPDGSWLQYLELQEQGALIPVEEAIATPGALLFSFSSEPTPGGGRPSSAHVAISLGDGQTIEARGRAYGVGSWDANTSRFEYAAVVPGLSGGSAALAAAAAPALLYEDSPDTDRDELTDAFETDHGLDPNSVDSDADGLSDAYELLQLSTDPLQADTDHDMVSDAIELSMGTDPLLADSDLDGRLDSASGLGLPEVDTDMDRLTDALEQVLGTDPLGVDSDHDGFADGLEHRGGFDPLDPLSTPMAEPPQPGEMVGATTLTELDDDDL
jgi:Lysozyme like domain/NlpC/P60 family/Bacterial TSP3 repeat